VFVPLRFVTSVLSKCPVPISLAQCPLPGVILPPRGLVLSPPSLLQSLLPFLIGRCVASGSFLVPSLSSLPLFGGGRVVSVLP
jgi:hypothetical protein